MEMVKDSKSIAMMVTLEAAMDVTSTVKSRKIGIAKVVHQLKLALVSPSPQTDPLSQQQEPYIFSVRLFKVLDFPTFLLS